MYTRMPGAYRPTAASAVESESPSLVEEDAEIALSCPNGVSLAMVYAPEQPFAGLYEVEEGLTRGTIFRQLDKPFMRGREEK